MDLTTCRRLLEPGGYSLPKKQKNDTNSRLNFLILVQPVVPYHPYAYFLCCSLCTSGNDKENLLNELELLNLVLIMFFHSHGRNV